VAEAKARGLASAKRRSSGHNDRGGCRGTAAGAQQSGWRPGRRSRGALGVKDAGGRASGGRSKGQRIGVGRGVRVWGGGLGGGGRGAAVGAGGRRSGHQSLGAAGGRRVAGRHGGRAEAGASESQCGRQATGGGRTGRERRQWARGSWQHGSESSERERGRGTRRFFRYGNNFHRPPPADGSYVNFCRLAHQLCLEPMKIIVADKKLCFSYSDGLWPGAPPGGWQ
jgi:hypothetical protein